MASRITASAPTRIDLAGGTIDIWPLYLFHEGALTLNVAISLRAHAHIESLTDGSIELRSIDTDRFCRVRHWSELSATADLPLLALLARHYRLEGAALATTRRRIARAAAGIAGWSPLAIAACGALAAWADHRGGSPGAMPGARNSEDLLEVAMNVECQTIRVPTGVQDYRPALYGGDRRCRTPCGQDSSRRARRRSPRARAPGRVGLHGRAPQLGHEQLGDYQATPSTATARCSTASSASGTRQWPCAAA